MTLSTPTRRRPRGAAGTTLVSLAATVLLGGCGGDGDLATLARSGSEPERLVATEARRLCELQGAAFDSAEDQESFVDRLLAEAGLTRDTWEEWRADLDAEERAAVNDLYDRLCPR